MHYNSIQSDMYMQHSRFIPLDYTFQSSATIAIAGAVAGIYYCGVPGSPCLSKTGLMTRHVGHMRFYPPVDGLKGHWSVSRRGPEPKRFFGDPISLARDNIINGFHNN